MPELLRSDRAGLPTGRLYILADTLPEIAAVQGLCDPKTCKALELGQCAKMRSTGVAWINIEAPEVNNNVIEQVINNAACAPTDSASTKNQGPLSENDL